MKIVYQRPPEFRNKENFYSDDDFKIRVKDTWPTIFVEMIIRATYHFEIRIGNWCKKVAPKDFAQQ